MRYLGFDFKIVSKGKLAGNFRTLYVSYDRGSEEFDYAETQSDPLEWKRQEAKLKSIFVTDKTFQHPLTEVKSGDRFWIKAKASSGCEGVIDRAVVTIYPEGEDE